MAYKLDKKDVAKDILLFIPVTVVAFAYWMLLLLLISFLTLSFLHFTIEGIFIASIVGTVVVDIIYVVSKIRAYQKEMKKYEDLN